MNAIAVTPEQFGKSYALLEAKQSSNDEDLFSVLGKLPDYAAYIDFRTKFKAGAIAAGYIETGFDKLWSRIVARLVADFGYTVPVKPVTTKGSEAVAKSREKKKSAVAELVALPEDEIKARIDSLGKAIAKSAAKGETNLAATTEANRYFKALEAKRKESSKAANEETKQLIAELREIIKSAPVDTLKAMLAAAKADIQKLAVPAKERKAA